MNTHPDIKPCRHVQRYVESQATGTPRKWWNFFGWLHVRNCPKCQEAMNALKNYFSTIQSESISLNDSTEETKAAILQNLRLHSNEDNPDSPNA